jgi:hypothetical protein
MKGFYAFVILLLAGVFVTVARGGHEVPAYPSFYPHQIDLRTLAPEQAPAALRDAKIHAYVGALRFPAPLPDAIRTVESLGSFVVVRVNPLSPLAKDEASTCVVVTRVARELASKPGDVVAHRYPVTPFHGDYLYHADLAEAANARYSDAATGPSAAVSKLKIRASGRLAQSHPDWSAQGADWDAEVIEIDAAGLTASAMLAVNGWLAPPWVRTGWFHAERLLAGAINDTAAKQRIEADLQRLTTGDFHDVAERINLERDLVTSLTAGCRNIVAGYTVKREYFNVEFSAGIENVGYDAIEGLQSPMFIRTVKLKDFPWNGWLALGIDAQPKAAWNPIGGMNDRFGRLMWFAVGDPALVASPYEAGWMLNRIADIPPNSPQ